jgi:hypothetical protein
MASAITFFEKNPGQKIIQNNVSQTKAATSPINCRRLECSRVFFTQFAHRGEIIEMACKERRKDKQIATDRSRFLDCREIYQSLSTVQFNVFLNQTHQGQPRLMWKSSTLLELILGKAYYASLLTLKKSLHGPWLKAHTLRCHRRQLTLRLRKHPRSPQLPFRH